MKFKREKFLTELFKHRDGYHLTPFEFDGDEPHSKELTKIVKLVDNLNYDLEIFAGAKRLILFNASTI